LSGCPSVTDSEVKRNRFAPIVILLSYALIIRSTRCNQGPAYRMLAAHGDVAMYSTGRRVRLQAPNMKMGQHQSSGLLKVAVGKRELVPLPLQMLMQQVG
jgi:hypothetical protein